MHLFENKGFINIILFVFNNKERKVSSYIIENNLPLSRNTIIKRIKDLEEEKLIKLFTRINPRLCREIRLTLKGVSVANKLKEIENLLIRYQSK